MRCSICQFSINFLAKNNLAASLSIKVEEWKTRKRENYIVFILVNFRNLQRIWHFEAV